MYLAYIATKFFKKKYSFGSIQNINHTVFEVVMINNLHHQII